jgi:hypothetical protein
MEDLTNPGLNIVSWRWEVLKNEQIFIWETMGKDKNNIIKLEQDGSITFPNASHYIKLF